jgi:hypothetical protein
MKTPLVAVLALGLLAPACGDEPELPLIGSPSISPAGPASSLPSPTPTLPTVSASASAATSTLRVGTASIRLEGSIVGDVSLLMLASPAVYSPPPGSIAVVWTDGLQTMGITGNSFIGAFDTSANLSLSLQVRNGAELVVLASSGGECSITMATAIERSFTGSFTCRRLNGTSAAGLALTVNATGTFSATG